MVTRIMFLSTSLVFSLFDIYICQMISDLAGADPDALCRRLSVILDATADLNNMLSEPEKLYASLLERLNQAVPFFSGSLQVMEGDSARIVAFRGPLDPAVVMGLRFRMDPLFPNHRVVTALKTVAFADIRDEYPHFFTRKEEFNSGHIRSWLGVPMMVSGSVIGMITLDRNEVDPFSGDDIRLVQGFANHAAVAIRNAKTWRDLQDALSAKDTLLREIHHRVKNNLQLVSSLVDIHAGRLADAEARRNMEELHVRIRSISSIHERLYQSSNANKVGLDDYLRALADDVMHSFQQNDMTIRLELDLMPVTVDSTIAVPLGLITSELIMNSLKYAFPGGRSGTIRIGLAVSGSQTELTIGDDGVGMDTSLARHDSFGLLLVRNLALQISGEASLDSRSGHTVWVIRFPTG
jgi:two-component sensor histidine kinase